MQETKLRLTQYASAPIGACSEVSDRAVDAIVERSNGKVFTIAVVDVD